jgi:hypothetical protein
MNNESLRNYAKSDHHHHHYHYYCCYGCYKLMYLVYTSLLPYQNNTFLLLPFLSTGVNILLGVGTNVMDLLLYLDLLHFQTYINMSITVKLSLWLIN